MKYKHTFKNNLFLNVKSFVYTNEVELNISKRD